jgi:DNA-binding transcriptional MerR regulator
VSLIRIGELARRAGVKIATIRFYERQGILPEVFRRQSGYREYAPETVAVVQFIKRAQGLGFRLREAAELARLRAVPRSACSQAVRHARDKVAEIEQKMRELEAMRDALSELLAACAQRGGPACCPIIETLSGDAVAATPKRRRKGGDA